ncbi:ABC transporter permease [Cryptosporangium aurantiacum]|uniref:ABC-2 type transport system permease protein n=1 Tax=Cryptosporangium aurantiacum TaxID=134849 RepID=A0A1M7TVH7_9ACTN|nr:ABC transporter permease [Cryptosporangium aurantiacum]SHN74721.1 ABC-2 type transport system permease protein [Cryptosporangium aurantiacum]
MNTSSIVWLVASRELRTRLRAKSFVIGTLGLLAAITGYLVLSAWLASSSGPVIGLSGPISQLRPAIEAVAESLDEDIEVRIVGNVDDARREVRDGDLDVLLIGSAPAPVAVVDEELDDSVRGILTAVLQQQALERALERAGADPAAVQQAVAGAGVRVDALSERDPLEGERLVLAAVAMTLLYIALITYGSGVAQGVVEEKTSRVVELLLATVRPWQLLMGKILGIGLVGLVQLVILGGVGLIGATLAGQLTLPAAGVGTFVSLLGWYLLGFFLFASLFAAAGALVSRFEDMQSVISPLIMLLAIVFVVGLNLLIRDPRSELVEVLSLIPPFTTILMPARGALGVAPAWQIMLAVVLTLVALAVTVRLAGAVYQRGVLHTGSRLSLRAALRGPDRPKSSNRA